MGPKQPGWFSSSSHCNDSYALGIIGKAIALISRIGTMEFSGRRSNALGRSTFGLFLGELIFGRVADRAGRLKV